MTHCRRAQCTRRAFLKRGTSLVTAAGLGSLLGSRHYPLIGEAHAADNVAATQVREYSRGGMRYRRLGNTDLFISQLSFGSHIDPAFKKGEGLSEEGQARRDRQVARAFDLGVNMIDIYENAGQWEPVARIAKPRRDKVLVSLCRQFPDFVGKNIDQAALLYGHVDLYRIYVGDADHVSGKNLEDWDAMRKAKTAGKVRAIGISTHSERMMVSALNELEGLDYIMFPYNFIHARADYGEALPLAIKKNVGLIAIKPLAAGSIVRLDPFVKKRSIPENANTHLYKGRNKSLLPAVVAELSKGLDQLPGESLCQAALRFVYSRPFITSAMPGMFQEHEVEDNYAAMKRHMELGSAHDDARQGVLRAARQLVELQGSNWLPDHYRWLDKQWLA